MTGHKAQIYISRSILLSMKPVPISQVRRNLFIRAFTIYFMAILCLGAIPLIGVNVSATTTETLSINDYIRCDFESAEGASLVDEIDGNPGASSAAFWETNRTWLYWGNSTSAADDGPWGIGRGIFELTTPVSTAAYWSVNVTCWLAPITFLPPTFSEIGTYSQSSNGMWAAFNLGVGLVDEYGQVEHIQMHTSALQDSYWWLGGGLYNDQPPATWTRPATGTNYWTAATNTLANRPWTLEEIERMVVILDVSTATDIFVKANEVAGSGVSIGIGGIFVTVTPVSYSPPDYSGGFILRPDDDISYDGWHTPDYNETDMFSYVNETDDFSDYTDSYIQTNWTYENEDHSYITFSLTDTPDYAEDTQYTAYVWVIMENQYQLYDATILIGFGISDQPYSYVQMSASGVSEYWSNYSMVSNIMYYPIQHLMAPFTASPGPYTLDDLDNSIVTLNLLKYKDLPSGWYNEWMGPLNVTQIGVICIPYTADEIRQIVSEETTYGILWLIILYLPAIAIGQVVPKYGFAAGMMLMLWLFGATESGFFPITLMGTVAIAVALYKGG